MSSEYPTLPDDQGNINNVLTSDQMAEESQLKDSIQEKGILSVEMNHSSALPAIPEETSPEIRKFQLPQIVVTEENGLESVFTITKESDEDVEKPREGQVPRMLLTDVNGNESWLPVVPSIVITDANGNIKEEMENVYEPKSPAVNSFSDSSTHSDAELEIPEGDKGPIKTRRTYQDPARIPFTGFMSDATLHTPEVDNEPIKSSIEVKEGSKKPFKGLKKGASRFMQSVSVN